LIEANALPLSQTANCAPCS